MAKPGIWREVAGKWERIASSLHATKHTAPASPTSVCMCALTPVLNDSSRRPGMPEKRLLVSEGIWQRCLPALLLKEVKMLQHPGGSSETLQRGQMFWEDTQLLCRANSLRTLEQSSGGDLLGYQSSPSSPFWNLPKAGLLGIFETNFIPL